MVAQHHRKRRQNPKQLSVVPPERHNQWFATSAKEKEKGRTKAQIPREKANMPRERAKAAKANTEGLSLRSNSNSVLTLAGY